MFDAVSALTSCPVRPRRGPGVRRGPPKTVWNESGRADDEDMAALVAGLVAARLEKLLLAPSFLLELRDLFGVDELGGVALAGEAFLAILPEVFGEDAVVERRKAEARAEHRPEPILSGPRPLSRRMLSKPARVAG